MLQKSLSLFFEYELLCALIRSPMKSTKVGLVNNMTGLVKMAVPTDCFRDNFEFSNSNKLDHKSTGRLLRLFYVYISLVIIMRPRGAFSQLSTSRAQQPDNQKRSKHSSTAKPVAYNSSKFQLFV